MAYQEENKKKKTQAEMQEIRTQYRNGKFVGETRMFPKEMQTREISVEEFNKSPKPKKNQAAPVSPKAKAAAASASAKPKYKSYIEKLDKNGNPIPGTKKEPSFGGTMQPIKIDKKTGKKTYGPVRKMNFKTITEEEFNR